MAFEFHIASGHRKLSKFKDLPARNMFLSADGSDMFYKRADGKVLKLPEQVEADLLDDELVCRVKSVVVEVELSGLSTTAKALAYRAALRNATDDSLPEELGNPARAAGLYDQAFQNPSDTVIDLMKMQTLALEIQKEL